MYYPDHKQKLNENLWKIFYSLIENKIRIYKKNYATMPTDQLKTQSEKQGTQNQVLILQNELWREMCFCQTHTKQEKERERTIGHEMLPPRNSVCLEGCSGHSISPPFWPWIEDDISFRILYPYAFINLSVQWSWNNFHYPHLKIVFCWRMMVSNVVYNHCICS